MNRTIWVGAVAYDPKVVTIWEGMRRYFHEEAHLPVEVVLFQSYEMQVAALLAGPGDPTPKIDIAWNTNLAYLLADSWSNHRCRPIAMRDTDLGWMTKIVAVSGGQFLPCPILKIARWRSVVATAAMPRSCRFTFWSAKAWLRGGTIARFASTVTSASTAIPAQARLRSFEPYSMAAPTPARSAALFGKRCAPSDWCRRAH